MGLVTSDIFTAAFLHFFFLIGICHASFRASWLRSIVQPLSKARHSIPASEKEEDAGREKRMRLCLLAALTSRSPAT